MKKFAKVMLCIGLCLLVVGGVLMGCGMLSGAKPVELVGSGTWNMAISVPHGEDHWDGTNQYRFPGESLRKLEINWVNGEVRVEPWDEAFVQIEETADAPITARNHLVYQWDGKNLEIDYCQKSVGFMIGPTIRISKDLTVRIPRDWATKGQMDILTLDCVDADFTLQEIAVKSVSVNSVSGSLYGTDLLVDEIEMNTVSGNLNSSFRHCPRDLEMNSTSGSVELRLPEDAQFEVSMDSVSGKLQSEFPVTIGAVNEFDMDTVSGDFAVKKSVGRFESQPAQPQTEAEPSTALGETAQGGDTI